MWGAGEMVENRFQLEAQVSRLFARLIDSSSDGTQGGDG